MGIEKIDSVLDRVMEKVRASETPRPLSQQLKGCWGSKRREAAVRLLHANTLRRCRREHGRRKAAEVRDKWRVLLH